MVKMNTNGEDENNIDDIGETDTLKPHGSSSNLEQTNTVDESSDKIKTFYMYCLMAICIGLLEPLGPTLYVELQTQLNISEEAIAFCFTTRSVASIISAIISGKVVDYFVESHRYVALISIIFIASITYLPYTHNIFILHAIFAVIGYVYNGYFVVIFVYVLRLYSEQKREAAGHKLYIILGIYGLTKTIYPLIMQISVQYTDKYIYPLYAILVLFVILIILLLTLKTPKHDKLRTIKAELKDEKDVETKDANNILHILNSDFKNRLFEITIILILSGIEFSYSAMQEYYTTFVIIYCKDTHIGEQYGRYLMSAYFA
eukprot:781870_1